MKLSEKLAQEIAAKAKESAVLIDKGESMTSDELKKANELLVDIKRLRGDHESAVTVEAASAETTTFVDKLTGQTTNLRHSGREVGDVKVEGWSPAGETIFERGRDERGRKYLAKVYEEGEGILDEKTLALVSSSEYKQAWRTYMRKGERYMTGAQFKTLQEGLDASGGFAVPDDVLNTIIQRKVTPLRAASRVTRLTTSRDRVLIPKVNYSTDDVYSTGIRVTWGPEVPPSAAGIRVTDPIFGQVGIPIHTALMSMLVTVDMIEDAAFGLVQWVSSKFGETIDVLYDDKILNGTGIGQPYGILNNPGGTQQPAVVNLGNPITADGIIAAVFSLPEQYDEDAVLMFKKTTTGKTIAQLKDANNRYLWGLGVDDSGLSVPIKGRKLLGYEVLLSQLMPDTGANNFPLIFGDFSGYYLVNRVGFSIQVFRELYAETNQVLLLGRIRLGGQPAEEWKLKIGKQA